MVRKMATATLGGVPLLASSIVRWRLAGGVAPVIEVFDISNANVPSLVGKRPGSITLVLKDDEREVSFEKLSILGLEPGPNKFITKVTVADRRWVWPYRWIFRRFNWRRNAGFLRRGKFQEELQPVPVRDVQYAKFSRKEDGNIWTPDEALKNILTAPDALGTPSIKPKDKKEQRKDDVPLLLGLDEADILIAAGGFDQTLKQQRLDNIMLDDPGDAAVDRLLKMIPGANLYINEKGQVVLYSEVDGGERNAVFPETQEMVDGGHVKLVTNEETRPSRVDVYFTIECELRFDAIEEETVVETAADAKPNVNVPEPRRLANVLPLPDFTLPVDGVRLTQGTWVDFPRYLRAISGFSSGLFSNMSQAKWFRALRRAFIPEMNLWAALGLVGNIRSGNKEADFAVRLAAMQGHYRTTYRIPSTWMDNMLSISPWLVGTIDPVSGQRAPAMVFSDYAVKTSQKALVNLALQGGKDATALVYATNVNGYRDRLTDEGSEEEGGDDPDEARKARIRPRPAPAVVIILDNDQGVLRVNYQIDPYGLAELVFPSKIDNPPCLGPGCAKRNDKLIAFNAASADGSKHTQLSKNHRVAILLTATPAAPNSKRQLYRVEVNRNDKDLISRLPKVMRAGLNKAFAPVQEIHVGAGLETARLRWKDDTKSVENIEAIFGIRDKEPDFTDLIINDAPQKDIAEAAGNGTAASLREIAVSIAANIYAQQHDRIMGTQTGAMRKGLVPTGNLSDVSYELAQNGVMTNPLSLPSQIKALSIFAFMDESTRRIIERQPGHE